MELLYFKMSYQGCSKERLCQYLNMWMCFNFGRLTLWSLLHRWWLWSIWQAWCRAVLEEKGCGWGLGQVQTPSRVGVHAGLSHSSTWLCRDLLWKQCVGCLRLFPNGLESKGGHCRPVLGGQRDTGFLISLCVSIRWWYWPGGHPELLLEYSSARVPVSTSYPILGRLKFLPF